MLNSCEQLNSQAEGWYYFFFINVRWQRIKAETSMLQPQIYKKIDLINKLDSQENSLLLACVNAHTVNL